MRLEALEAEKRILETAEKRLAIETSELSQEKFKLAAELDIKQKQYSELEESSTKEISKYQAAAVRAENELGDAQRELAINKAKAENATKELSYVKEEMEKNIDKLEKKLADVTNELSKAQQRATSAEAKAELLQEAVRKSEERVARLEIEKNSRIQSSDDKRPPEQTPVGNVAAVDADERITELNAEIKMLREELSAAQETAAALTGHSKQFEALAHTAEEALKSVQDEHEKYKADSEIRRIAQMNEIKKLTNDLNIKSEELKSSKESQAKLTFECDELKQAVEQVKQNGKKELQQTLDHLTKEQEKVSLLDDDLNNLRKQLDEAKKSYDAEVVAHGDALRRVASSEAAVASLQNRLNVIVADLEKERSSRHERDSEQLAKIENLMAQNKELSKKLDSLAQQRDTLQAEIEKAASAGVSGGGDFKNTLRMLRQEKEAAEINLQLAERELNRLKVESVSAKRAAEEARSQLTAELNRQKEKTSERESDESNKQEQINILRESNSALRTDNTSKQTRIKNLEKKLADTEQKIEPLQMEIKNLQASIESGKREAKAAEENAARWEKRAKLLSEKTPEVDVADHEKLQSDLKSTQEDLQKSKAEIDKRLKERELLQKRVKEAELKAHTANAQINKLNKEIEGFKATKSSGAEEVVKLRNLLKEKAVQIQNLETKLKELERSEATLKQTITVHETKMDELKKSRVRVLKTTEKAVERKNFVEAENTKLKNTIQSLESEIAALKEPKEEVNVEEMVAEIQGDEDQLKSDGGGIGSKRKLQMEPADDQTKKLRATAPIFTPTKEEQKAEEAPEEGTTGKFNCKTKYILSTMNLVHSMRIYVFVECEIDEETSAPARAEGSPEIPDVQGVPDDEKDEPSPPEDLVQEEEEQVEEAEDIPPDNEEQAEMEEDTLPEEENPMEVQENSDNDARAPQGEMDDMEENAEEKSANKASENADDEAEKPNEDIVSGLESKQPPDAQAEKSEKNEGKHESQAESQAQKISKGKRVKIEWKGDSKPAPTRKISPIPIPGAKLPTKPNLSATATQKSTEKGKKAAPSVVQQNKQQKARGGQQSSGTAEKDKTNPSDPQ